MVRPAAAVLAVMILPTFALGQEPQGTHDVVKDDTLWDLAQHYYSNPFEWRVIWNANRDLVEDPNWIYPAEILVIPGLPGDANSGDPAIDDSIELMEEPAEDPRDIDGVPADLVPFGLRQARPVTESARTVFYRDTTFAQEGTEGAMTRDYTPVSTDAAYSAPWLIGLAGDPESHGVIAGFAERGSRAGSIRSYEKIRITMPSSTRVGATLQLFRVSHSIEDVGQVVSPTGLATVQMIGDGEVIAIVTKEYDRILPGDFVAPVPTYEGRPGVYAQEVSGGFEAMVLGFAGRQGLTDIGHIAFLDLGSDDGVTIGDEFVLFGDAIPTAREGVLQIVGVTETMSSARVISMTDNVFRQGVVVRLAKKMR